MHHFLGSGPLELVVKDIIGTFSKTGQGKQSIFVNTDRYSKLARALPKSETTVTHIANVLMDYWPITHDISTYLYTENRTQLARNFFAEVRAPHEVKHVSTAAYHLQTSDQAERFNKTILTCVRHFVAEH